MRTHIVLTLSALVPLTLACADPQRVNPTPSGPARYTSQQEARCAYEAKKAFAGARERTIGDSIDNAVQEAKLRRMCLESL